MVWNGLSSFAQKRRRHKQIFRRRLWNSLKRAQQISQFYTYRASKLWQNFSSHAVNKNFQNISQPRLRNLCLGWCRFIWSCIFKRLQMEWKGDSVARSFEFVRGNVHPCVGPKNPLCRGHSMGEEATYVLYVRKWDNPLSFRRRCQRERMCSNSNSNIALKSATQLWLIHAQNAFTP